MVGQTLDGGPEPVALRVRRDLRRNRLTSFFRLLLVIPHLVVLVGLYTAVYAVAVVGWFGALALGRLPAWAHEFLGGVLRWSVRVNGYFSLLTDRYPPFAWGPTDYPVELVLPAPGRLRRWAVLGRIVLAIPALVISALLGGIQLFLIFAWFAAVFAGRVPRAVFDALATVLRYQARLGAYLLLLTPTYPWGPLADGVEAPRPPVWAPPGYGPPPGYGLPPGYGPVGYPPPPAGPIGDPPPPYPPMPPVSPADDRAASQAGWYEGVVTGGGRAILIVALVLGAAQLVENGVLFAAGGAIGGFGSLRNIGQTFDLTLDKQRFDRAIDDASCPVPGAACNQRAAASLLAESGRLSGDVRGADSAGPQRNRLATDLATFDRAVRRAADAGSLVDASGGITDYQVLTTQTRIDQDIDDLLKALR